MSVVAKPTLVLVLGSRYSKQFTGITERTDRMATGYTRWQDGGPQHGDHAV